MGVVSGKLLSVSIADPSSVKIKYVVIHCFLKGKILNCHVSVSNKFDAS